MQFKKVIANQSVKQRLIAQVNENRVSHAQLFEEREGSGALALAIAYAQYINCLQPVDNDSCGSCSSCIKFEKLQHPDVQLIFPTATTKEVSKNPTSSQFFKEWTGAVLANPYLSLQNWIELLEVENKQVSIAVLDSEEILNKLSLRAYEAKKKIIILWFPEKMNIATSNKLLKILEEPDPHTVFLLVCQDLDALLPTILSRVQIIKVAKPSMEEIASGLPQNFDVSEEAAKAFAAICENNVNRAIELASGNEDQDFYIVNFQNWMRYCYTANVIEISQWVDAVATIGREKQKNLAEYGLRFFRECLVYNFGSNLNTLHEKEIQFLQKFAPFIHGGNIVLLSEAFEDLHNQIMRNANPKITFMNLSLNISKMLKLKAEF
ncbi:MAG: ATP-binding protein [Flavobacteriales bacterium]